MKIRFITDLSQAEVIVKDLGLHWSIVKGKLHFLGLWFHLNDEIRLI